jgi:DNA polymerase-4
VSADDEPTILHVDMDAFFVSVELLDRPDLRGRPVIVGGPGARGVVAAASYEARAYGVHSAMPSVRARRLCPQAIFLPGRYDRYAEASAGVMARFRDVTPLVEPLSLDEAFLDVTGARRLHGPAPAIAHDLRRRIHDDLGLTCSVGVAPTKFVAKLASEAAKPRASLGGTERGLGVKVVRPGDVLGFLHPLPVRALWGVGPATYARLQRFGIATVGDLAGLPVDVLVGALGTAHGRHLHALANGIDDRRVEPERAAKSVGHEETFPVDRHDRTDLGRELARYADAVATRLRHGGLAARTVSIKVRYGDFRTLSRSTTLPVATDSTRDVARAAQALLAGVEVHPGVRLLGVSVSGLAERPARQLSFDELDGGGKGAGREAWDEAEAVVDAIRERFGAAAIGPAAVVGERGLRVKRRGSQQWGPDD